MSDRGINEILVHVHASKKVPGAVQYSSDERSGSISLRSSIGPNDSIEGTIKMLWDLAEVELERQGLTVVKRDAEVGSVRPIETRSAGGGSGMREIVRLLQDDKRGGPSPSGAPGIPSGPAPAAPNPGPLATNFKPATEPSQVTPEQAKAAAFKRRHAKILDGIQTALNEKSLTKREYATLMKIIQQAFGKAATIGRFSDLPAPALVDWANEMEGGG
jgi:hypothetical protein